MDYKLSKQVTSAEMMIIDVIAAKAEGIDDFVSMSIGSPSPETFPVDKIKHYYDVAFDTNADSILSYSGGRAKAIEEIKKWLEGRGFDLTGKALHLIPGSGPGMDVMCATFCDKGDIILTEEFTYPGIMDAARFVEAQCVPVKTGLDGIDLDDLRAKAEKYHPKFLYIVPTFSNPLGVTIDEEKRKGILKIASECDFMVYEDDPYSQLRFKGDPVPEMIKLDTEGRVVHAETFSKTLSSGIRVGFLLYDEKLAVPLMFCLGNNGGCSGPTEQMVGEFLANEDFPAQIKVPTAYYQAKLEVALKALEDHMPEGVKWTKPEGGMFIWVECPEKVDTEKLCFDLIERKHVGMVPSSGFSPDGVNKGHGFRLCISISPTDKIDGAIASIAELIQEQLDA